jgi:HK97 family phage major capsid protein
VPFLVSVPSQTGGAAAQWVGEGAPKPVGALQFGSVTLGTTKCAIIVVITDELAKNSTPDAETVIRTDLVNAIAFLVDTEFTLPARAPVANVSPGSVTNGVTPITSAGTSPSNGRTDINAMISALVAAGLSAAQSVLLMSESNAAALSAALNPLGQPLFAALNITGGSALGIPVITSQAVGSNVILLHSPSILFADEGGVSIDVSREASLQMDSAPMNPPDATIVMTSLWQSNRVGIRAERTINWKKARAGCVQYTVQTYVA